MDEPRLSLLTLKASIAKVAQKRFSSSGNGLACLEPCSFPRCMNSCWRDFEDAHHDHVCSEHRYKAKTMTQQPSVATIASDSNVKVTFDKLTPQPETPKVEVPKKVYF